MNSLITASLAAGDVRMLAKFPPSLMYDHEVEIVSWIIKYQQKYDRLPTIERVTRQFKTFVALYSEENQPLQDVLDIEVEERRREMAMAMVAEIDEALTGGDDIPVEKIQALAQLMAISSGGILDYAEFDRSEYFRSNEQGLSWGFHIFDHATGGIRDGEFALIAGRLGVGKTTLLKFLVRMWFDQGKRILYVSNESSTTDVFLGLDAIIGKFNPLTLRRGGEEAESIKAQMRSVMSIVRATEGKIMVPSARLLKPAQIAAVAKFLNVDVIVVDGVYLLQADFVIPNKYERISQVSNELKQMALDLGVKVVGVTQIKRVDGKKEYDSEDLAFSDSLGQDADFVISMIPSEEKNTFEASFIKNRYGPRVATAYRVDFDSMSLTEVEISEEEEEWGKRDNERSEDENSI